MESELSKRLQEVMVMMYGDIDGDDNGNGEADSTDNVFYFRLVEDWKRRPTVKWARSWGR